MCAEDAATLIVCMCLCVRVCVCACVCAEKDRLVRQAADLAGQAGALQAEVYRPLIECTCRAHAGLGFSTLRLLRLRRSAAASPTSSDG